jgi:hypothetical protein
MSFKSLALDPTIDPSFTVVDLAGSAVGAATKIFLTFTPVSNGFLVMHVDLGCSARSNTLAVRVNSPNAFYNAQDPFTQLFCGVPSGTLSPRTWVVKVNANQPYNLECNSVGSSGTVYFSGTCVYSFLSA